MKFILEKQNEGCPLTREIIRLLALEGAANLSTPRNNFKVSMGWHRKMKRRDGLALRHADKSRAKTS